MPLKAKETTTQSMPCRVRLQLPEGNDTKPVNLKTYHHDIPLELRNKWATAIRAHFSVPNETEPRRPRSWDFLLQLDGSVSLLDPSNATQPLPTCKEAYADDDRMKAGKQAYIYPPRCQIPPATLEGLGLDAAETVRRAEMFAMASLLYEVMTGGKKPFGEEIPDDDGQHGAEIQRRFVRGEFPDDVEGLPGSLYILSGWSAEFADYVAGLAKNPDDKRQLAVVKRESGGDEGEVELVPQTTHVEPRRLVGGADNRAWWLKVKDHVQTPTFQRGLLIAGGVLTAVPVLLPVVLGAVGFTAGGVVAGSAAAAWQSSMGVVQAGSLFAWCQSAAMGGTALGGVQAVGLAGAGLARVAQLPGLVGRFNDIVRRR